MQQISGERLQDHWPSGLIIVAILSVLSLAVFSLKLKVSGPEIKIAGTSTRQSTKLNEFLSFFNGKIL